MSRDKHRNLNIYLNALLALVFSLTLIIFPEEAFAASLEGLRLWAQVVLPALLPFFVMAELLMGFGVVHFIGTLLEPIMQPIFKIPGVGAFAVAIGLASGYPIGAKITGQLRRKKLCSQIEAERLISFANTADPLFIAGAVAVGMFNMPELSVVLLLAHYLSAVIVGFFMRFHKNGELPINKQDDILPKSLISRAKTALVNARVSDGRPFGSLLSDAILDTFKSLFFVGGCIVMFAVLSRLFEISGITSLVSNLVFSLLSFTDISRDIINAIISGFFEIDIGAQAISVATAPLNQKMMAVSAIIGWSGLSVHAQVAAMIHGTDIRIKPYITARIFHAIFAGVLTVILLRPAQVIWHKFKIVIPVFYHIPSAKFTFSSILTASTKTAFLVTLTLIIIGLILSLVNRIVLFWVRQKN